MSRQHLQTGLFYPAPSNGFLWELGVAELTSSVDATGLGFLRAGLRRRLSRLTLGFLPVRDGERIQGPFSVAGELESLDAPHQPDVEEAHGALGLLCA